MNTLSTAPAAGRAASPATPAMARGLNPAYGPAGFRQALQSAAQAADDTAASDGPPARHARTDEETSSGPLALPPAEAPATPANGGADATPNALDLSSLLAQMGHQGGTPTPTAGSATTSASQDDAGIEAAVDGGGRADARTAAGARRHLPARGTSAAPSGTAQPAASAAPLGSAAPSASAAPLVAGTPAGSTAPVASGRRTSAGPAVPAGPVGPEALDAPAPTAAALAAKAAGARDGRAQAASGQAQPPNATLSEMPATGQAAASPLAAAATGVTPAPERPLSAARPASGRPAVDGVSGRAVAAERGSRAAAGNEARTAGAQARDSRPETVAGANELPATATPGMPGTAGQPTQANGPDPTAAPQDSTLASTLMASAATAPVPTQPGAAPAAPPPGTATSPFHAYVAAAVQSRGFAPALGAQMRMLVSEGVSEAQLELNPPDMGPVSVRIALEGMQARVEFGADLADTRAALQDSMPSLAAALRESGFTLTGGGVSERQAGGGSGASGEEPGGRRSPNAPAGVGAGRGDVAATPAGPAAPAAGRGRSTVDLYA
ncbi:flagellar hook-length control protein FliK [Azohydromonas lata]|uniref:flagellar hook-length control protein FliK n=1 Tax=Azohydromonas lata TaxID=45677 RepID=UPI00082DB450|nr:flagellar hook-length control protein FliK [Azohydromonas lata]